MTLRADLQEYADQLPSSYRNAAHIMFSRMEEMEKELGKPVEKFTQEELSELLLYNTKSVSPTATTTTSTIRRRSSILNKYIAFKTGKSEDQQFVVCDNIVLSNSDEMASKYFKSFEEFDSIMTRIFELDKNLQFSGNLRMALCVYLLWERNTRTQIFETKLSDIDDEHNCVNGLKIKHEKIMDLVRKVAKQEFYYTGYNQMVTLRDGSFGSDYLIARKNVNTSFAMATFFSGLFKMIRTQNVYNTDEEKAKLTDISVNTISKSSLFCDLKSIEIDAGSSTEIVTKQLLKMLMKQDSSNVSKGTIYNTYKDYLAWKKKYYQ